MDQIHVTDAMVTLSLEIISLLTGEVFAVMRSGDLVAIMAPHHHFVIPERIGKQKLLQLINKLVAIVMKKGDEQNDIKVETKEEEEEEAESVAGDERFTANLGLTLNIKLEESSIAGGHTPEKNAGERRSPSLSVAREEGERVNTSVRPNRHKSNMDPEPHTTERPPDPGPASLSSFPCSECGKCFASRVSLKKHATVHNGRSYYSCAECGKRFKLERTLQEHRHVHSGEKPYSCSQCDKAFSKKLLLRKHQRRIHAGGPREATVTDQPPLTSEESPKTPPALETRPQQGEDRSHIKAETKEEEEETPVTRDPRITANDGWRTGNIKLEESSTEHGHTTARSGKEHRASPSLSLAMEDDDVIKTSVGEDAPESNRVWYQSAERPPDPCDPGHVTDSSSFQCSECGKCFTSQVSLRKHVTVHDGTRYHSCTECGKRFKREQNLQEHRHAHSGEKPYSCSQCQKAFSKKLLLRNHQRRVHAGQEREKFSCPECGKSFTTKAYLQIHQQSHLGLKPFKCPSCDKSFAAKMYLKRHQQSHARHRGLKCPECGKCFSSKDVLGKHLHRHRAKAFECQECGKRFSDKSGLTSHFRVHTGERPFSCPECGRAFSDHSTLVNHLRVHTNERPFSCSECGKAFTLRSVLVAHLKIHTGERPFACSECGKSFAEKRLLVSHQRLHTGERPHPCPQCGKCFRHRASLLCHLSSRAHSR